MLVYVWSPRATEEYDTLYLVYNTISPLVVLDLPMQESPLLHPAALARPAKHSSPQIQQAALHGHSI